VSTVTTLANLKGPQGDQGVQGIPGTGSATTDVATAALLALYSSASSKALRSSLGLVVPQEFGAVGNGVADDTTALQSAITAAISRRADLFIPQGTYMVSNTLTIGSVAGFRLHMAGRIKRVNAAVNRVCLIELVDCTDFYASVIRTDGNVATNGADGFTVDQAKHDLVLTNCTGVRIGLLDSVNPAGDSLYVRGGTGINQNVQIDTVSSISDGLTGRNAVSIIKGRRLQFGKILSINTGHPGQVSGPAQTPMPGGFDIEPNVATDIVEDVSVDSLIVETAGSAGFSIMSAFGQIIKRVTVGQVVSEKLAGALGASTGGIIRGCSNVRVGSIRHIGGGVATGFAVTDADDVQIDLRLTNVTGAGLNIGSTATVTNFKITGSIRTTAAHCVVIYAADGGEIDMTLRDAATGYAALSKNAGGTSSQVRFRGDWSKGTTGTWMVNLAAAVTGWILDGVRAEGWGSSFRLSGASAATVATLNCPGLNFLVAAPNNDGWKAGTIVWNSAPAASTAPGWVCTVAGVPGTWKAMGNVAA